MAPSYGYWLRQLLHMSIDAALFEPVGLIHGIYTEVTH
jgi:hypothetical protein